MSHPPTDIILGQRALDLLRYIIDSRGPCKVSIPETPFCWTTLLSAIEREGSTDLLLIQGNPELLEALSLTGKGEVLLEYADENGVLCHFRVAVIRTSLERIWGKFPAVIYRVQRRMFFRAKAEPGTEVVFMLEPGREMRGGVRDYSLGGAAFWSEEPLPLKTEDLVEDLCLRIPEKGAFIEVPIYAAVVRRVEPRSQPGKSLYALEFLGMSRWTRRLFASHILGKKRMLLRKFKIPPFLLGGPRGLQRVIPAAPSAALGKRPPYLSAWSA
jgi:c-di-GMP-binding flagellar brake protein YcgR